VQTDLFDSVSGREPRRLRIAQVAPPLERVPPAAYGGTERVVFELTAELVRRGHDVTVIASGDSEVPCRLIPTVERALRPEGFGGDPSPYFLETLATVFDHASEFDVIHSHLEWWSLALGRVLPVPMASTFHGRLDVPWSRRLLTGNPSGLVAISRSQAAAHPNVDWSVIHNGLSLVSMPFATSRTEEFCFVGRVDAGKGILEAMEIAAMTGRNLRIAAKIGNLPEQRAYYDDVFEPALKKAGSLVEYLGELGPEDRNRLFSESYAALMPGAWPEPFGLVAIEALACGTPVLARRVGALPEIIRDGVDGFFGDDSMHLAYLSDNVGDLDRRAIRERVIDRFSAARMTDRYEELYGRLIDASPATVRLPPRQRASRSSSPGGAGAAAHVPSRAPESEELPDPDASVDGPLNRPSRALPERPVASVLVPVGPGADEEPVVDRARGGSVASDRPGTGMAPRPSR
jgi:glycosyltransferase involved in cell wall biosynthesis